MVSSRNWTFVIAAWVFACPSGQASVTEQTQAASPAPESASASSALPIERRPVPWRQTPALEVIRAAWENARLTTYDSITRVDESSGDYHFDCSGFVQWVLRQSHPVAARWAASGLPHRPLARNFHSRITSVPAGVPRFGWQRVQRVADILPGDVIAWIKPREVVSKNTGHVVFAVLPPQWIEGGDTYLLRIADATRLWHAEDTRNWQGETPMRRSPLGPDTRDESPNDQGLGFGTISLVADPKTGAPVQYGWVATQWRTFETRIAIGRPVN